jgi:hypothetical protein
MNRGDVFLMYHELELPERPTSRADRGYECYCLPEANFRDQIRLLHRLGFRGVSVSEAHPESAAVAITFDDGCETDLNSAQAGAAHHPNRRQRGKFEQICQGWGLWLVQLRDFSAGVAKRTLGRAAYDKFRSVPPGSS